MSAAGGLLLAGVMASHARAAESSAVRTRGKSRIGVLFTGDPQPADRNWGADAGQVEAMTARLAEAEKKLGNIELVVGESRSPEESVQHLANLMGLKVIEEG